MEAATRRDVRCREDEGLGDEPEGESAAFGGGGWGERGGCSGGEGGGGGGGEGWWWLPLSSCHWKEH